MTTIERKYKPTTMQRIGQRFGRWTITGIAGYVRPNCLHFHARCDCGYEAVVMAGNLYKNKSTQCYRCGMASASQTQVAQAAARRKSIKRILGRDVVGWKKYSPLFKCDDCGQPTANKKCRACARKTPRKGPKSLSSVAAEFGVTKQYVSLLLARMTWREMIETLKRRNNPTPTTPEVASKPQKKRWAYTREERDEMFVKCRDYLQQNPNANWEELWWSVPNHYKCPGSMQSAMYAIAARNGSQHLKATNRGDVK